MTDHASSLDRLRAKKKNKSTCQQRLRVLLISLGTLVNYYLANLPLVLLMLVQALGAPIGRPAIRNGQPRVGHYNASLGLWERCHDPCGTAASLVAYWRWAGDLSLSFGTLLATCHCSQHGQRDILAEYQLSIAR